MHLGVLAFVFVCIIYSHAHNIKQCTSKIYCNGLLLDTVQKSGLFADSKTFVDMPTRHSEREVLAAFAELGKNPTLKQVKRFVEDNFMAVGSELESVQPEDWEENPAFLEKIKSPRLRDFAQTLHEKWRALLRKSDPSKKCGECVMSSLNLKHPFIIPGGRFREFYYWDSFWILEGLMVSGMCRTANHTIENMLALVEEFGFVPNGSRVYYLTRSQPPLLIDMVERFMDGCGIKDKPGYIKKIIGHLESEYEFWMEHRTVSVGNGYQLNVYRADQKEPRPESYREDTSIAGALDRSRERGKYYQHIASAAESGWDFSGRWFGDGQSMSQIRTCKIVPVDLNSILYNNELKLAMFYKQHLNDQIGGSKYEQAAERRRKVMKKFMHDGKFWGDYDLELKQMSNQTLYMSTLMPLFFRVDSDSDSDHHSHITSDYDNLIQKYPGGAVISEANTGQQWDFPNVWAPLQYRLIKWWLEQGEREKALELAQRFMTSCICGYQKYGYVFEKYHGERVGEPGGGGEYVVQEGFGWTIGVLLWALNIFPGELTAPITCTRYESSLIMGSPHVHADRVIISMLFIVVIVVGIIVVASRLFGMRKDGEVTQTK